MARVWLNGSRQGGGGRGGGVRAHGFNLDIEDAIGVHVV